MKLPTTQGTRPTPDTRHIMTNTAVDGGDGDAIDIGSRTKHDIC